jgi:hypothetical protein
MVNASAHVTYAYGVVIHDHNNINFIIEVAGIGLYRTCIFF